MAQLKLALIFVLAVLSAQAQGLDLAQTGFGKEIASGEILSMWSVGPYEAILHQKTTLTLSIFDNGKEIFSIKETDPILMGSLSNQGSLADLNVSTDGKYVTFATWGDPVTYTGGLTVMNNCQNLKLDTTTLKVSELIRRNGEKITFSRSAGGFTSTFTGTPKMIGYAAQNGSLSYFVADIQDDSNHTVRGMFEMSSDANGKRFRQIATGDPVKSLSYAAPKLSADGKKLYFTQTYLLSNTVPLTSQSDLLELDLNTGVLEEVTTSNRIVGGETFTGSFILRSDWYNQYLYAVTYLYGSSEKLVPTPAELLFSTKKSGAIGNGFFASNGLKAVPLRTKNATTNDAIALVEKAETRVIVSSADSINGTALGRFGDAVSPHKCSVAFTAADASGKFTRLVYYYPVTVNSVEAVGATRIISGCNLNRSGTVPNVTVGGENLPVSQHYTAPDGYDVLVVPEPKADGIPELTYGQQKFSFPNVTVSGPFFATPLVTGSLTEPLDSTENVAPGSEVHLYGKDFAFLTTTTPVAARADRLPLPTAITGARVKVGGIYAPMYFAFTHTASRDSEVLFVVPMASSYGRQPIVVESVRGIENPDGSIFYQIVKQSAPLYVNIQAVAPSFYKIYEEKVKEDGKKEYKKVYDVKLYRPDGSIVSGANPARSEPLVAYFTGGGRTVTLVPDGEASASPLSAACTVTVAGVSAKIDYCGSQSQYPGIYQLNFVPDLGTKPTNGAAEVVVTIGGVSQSLWINYDSSSN